MKKKRGQSIKHPPIGMGGPSRDTATGIYQVGEESWVVPTSKGSRTVITSPSSAAAMDEAVEIYATALKRLATR